MQYKVTLALDATASVIVYAKSPEEAFDNAKNAVIDRNSVSVWSSEPIGCEDETGKYTECTA